MNDVGDHWHVVGTHGYIYDLILQAKKKANDRGVDCSTLIAQLEEDHQEVS